MRRLASALVVLACLAPARAEAQRIERLVEQVAIAADGSARVTVDLDWPAAGGARIWLPVASERASDIQVSSRQPATAAIRARNGRPQLAIDVEGSPLADDTLHVTYAIPRLFDPAQPALAHGARRLRYEFMNTTDLGVGAFQGVLVLPPGAVVAGVDEIAPEVPDSAVTSPYTLGRLNGRRTIVLDVAPLGWGDTAGLTVRFKQDRAPVPLLVILGLAGLGYLYRFRDLISARTR